MLDTITSRGPMLLPLVGLMALSACSRTKQRSDASAFTATTPATHRAFPMVNGPHAVDCALCHGTFPTFKQFD